MQSIKGLTAEVEIKTVPCLVKRGTAAGTFTPTDAVNDDVLGYVTARKAKGDTAAIYADSGVTRLLAEGTIAQDAKCIPSAATDGSIKTATGAAPGSTLVCKALHDAADGDLVEVLYYALHESVPTPP